MGMSDICEGNEQRQRKLLMLNVTKVSKFGFGLLFLLGAVYHHSDTINQAENFCASIGRTDLVTRDGTRECYYDLKDGLLISGTIMLFISIVTEAYVGINKNGYCTMFHVFGYLFLMIASMTAMIIVKTEELLLTNLQGGMWIAGGLLTAFCQGYLSFTWKAGGLSVITTFVCACIGSILFIGFGISRIHEVYQAWIDDDNATDYLNGSAGFLITGSLFYVLHAILYSVTIYGELVGITSTDEIEPEDQQSYANIFELSLSPFMNFSKPQVDGLLILTVSARFGFCILFFTSGYWA